MIPSTRSAAPKWASLIIILSKVLISQPALASDTSGSDLGNFLNPPDVPTGFLDYTLNPTYDIGSLQTLTWTAPFERINLYITQIKMSNESKHTLQYNHSNTGSFDWTVTSFDWDLSLTRISPGKVAFFGLQNAVFPYQAIYSAYFNFSTGDKTIVEDVQGATVTVISAPTGGATSSAGQIGLSNAHKIAVGLGLGLGLLLLLVLALAAWLTWRAKQLREGKAKAVYVPPAAPQRTRPSMPSQPDYVLSENDIPLRRGTPLEVPSLEIPIDISSRYAGPAESERGGLSTSNGVTDAATLVTTDAGERVGRRGEWKAPSHESMAYAQSFLQMYDY